MLNLPERTFSNYLLRPVKESDVFDYFVIGRNSEAVRYLSWYPFLTIEEAVLHFNNIYFSNEYKNDPRGYAIVDINTNKMIGTIDFHTYNKILKTAHVGYLLHPDYWNLGIITNALKIMVDVGFEVLKLRKIYVQTISENKASIRVCEKNDFRLLKIIKLDYYDHKTNRYYDIYKYVRERKL